MCPVHDCAHLHFEIHVEIEPCADIGPAHARGLPGFLCTRPARHGGPHVAWLGGRLLDTWPRGPAEAVS